ncbi:hypothetical protein [Flavobacterium sp. UBA7680]|uniref:hypothetical protein n=1 Tax=Flavobacterium sp. UBA7680 TaxID=1946559 RepID=UPI0025C4EDED|nr:hypothetical protein [Flavobacterium sp. UBA7680]
MAEIKQSEKLMIERILGMDGGYVLNFSNTSFQEFIFNLTKLDIYSTKYEIYGHSKAKRLKVFWQLESDLIVGKVIKELIEYWKTQKLISNQNIDSNEALLVVECEKIINRLLGIKSKEVRNDVSTINEFLNKEFKEISLYKLNIDSTVTEILNKRLIEINKSIVHDAPLSVIIMCGSVLEGILLGVASSKMREFNQSTASPKNKDTGKVLPFYDWTLSNFIDVAHNIGILGLDVKKYSHSLRDFRNYIHPYQQMSSGFNPDLDTAKISWQVLKAGINDLTRSINK